jgi:uncharacterized protein (TIGR03067 family)
VRTALLCLSAVALSAVAAPVPKAVKKPDDTTLLQGRWVCVTFDSGNGPKADDSYTLVVQDGKMWFGAGKTELPYAPFTLDTSRSPKHLDVSWPTWKEPQQYVYALDGDTLTLCHAQPNQPRPTEVKGGPGGHMSFVLKRVKE